ncbi:MAG: DUF3094 domain-containing protein [Porticoccus sp.]|jgi:hypothetical protein|uniref:DUF3094 domain-containing protein n=1 Tax=Porticoccus sp. TaxID=2024853 RepID=UPI0030D9F8BA|tara:strand:+ start:466834 stop:467022 length:189 start_codon:yes stop_codon:yes gene_type:complete
MGMRSEEEYSEEDLERIRQVVNSGVHSVERKPFRFSLLFLWWIVVAAMGGVAWFFARMIGAV